MDYKMPATVQRSLNYSRSDLSNRDNRNLSLAMNAAASSTCRMKHGAVIIRGGRVLSIGINKFRNNPAVMPTEIAKQVCSVHAEIDAIKKLDNARYATIYVARVNNLGKPMLSKPCHACYDAITDAGINKIVYTLP